MRGVMGLCLFWAMSVQAATYICVINGKAIYATQKLGDLCELSEINQGKTVFSPTPPISQTAENGAGQPENHQQEPDDLYYLWRELEFGADNAAPTSPMPNLPALPVRKPPVVLAPPQSSPPKASPKPKTPVQAAQPSVGVPSIQRWQRVGQGAANRRQVLLQALHAEQAALNIAREQLAAARKRNDVAATQKLSRTVLLGEQNVLGLMREIRR